MSMRTPPCWRTFSSAGVELMIALAADISTKTAPKIIATAIVGCILVGLLTAYLFRHAVARAEKTGELSRRADVRRCVLLIARFTQGHQRLFVGSFVLLSVEAVTTVFAWYPLTY